MGRDFEIFKGLIEQMVDGDQDEFCRIQLPGFMANKLRGYFGIKSDLNLIRATFLDYCNPDLNINRPVYYYMIVILYGKCFTNATSASHPNLEKKDVAKRKDLLEIHLELMDTRHNFIAHRGVTSQDDAVVYLAFEKKKPMNFHAGAKRGKREHYLNNLKSILYALRREFKWPVLSIRRIAYSLRTQSINPTDCWTNFPIKKRLSYQRYDNCIRTAYTIQTNHIYPHFNP